MPKKKSTIDSGMTVGEASLLAASSEEVYNPIELQQAVHAGNKPEDSFESQVLEALNRGRKDIWGSFFIVVLLKKERILCNNVVRQYFFARKSCPTPQYDQIVYKYDHIQESLEFIWAIPDKPACRLIKKTGHRLPPEQQQLVKFVADFHSGSLDRRCAALNGEPPE